MHQYMTRSKSDANSEDDRGINDDPQTEQSPEETPGTPETVVNAPSSTTPLRQPPTLRDAIMSALNSPTMAPGRTSGQSDAASAPESAYDSASIPDRQQAVTSRPTWKAASGFRLPPFNKKRIAAWLRASELAFAKAGVVDDDEKLVIANAAFCDAGDQKLANMFAGIFESWSSVANWLTKTFGQSEVARRRAIAEAPGRGNMPAGEYLALLIEVSECFDPRNTAIRDRLLEELPGHIQHALRTRTCSNVDLALEADTSQ